MKELSKHPDTGITPYRISAKVFIVAFILLAIEALICLVLKMSM